MSNTNSMVAHIWANQSKPSARSGNSNFHFSGPTIYSYSTPIAHLILDDAGKPVACLRTTRKFSATTSSKHEPAVSRALPLGLPSINVPVLAYYGAIDHAANLKYFEESMVAEFAKAKRSSTRAAWHFSNVESLVDQGNLYIRLFKLDHAPFTLPADFEAERDKVEDRVHRLLHPDPESADRRERRRAQRQKREAEKRAREEELRQADLATRRAAWLEGKVNHSPWGAPMALRLKPSNKEVLQTSQGAEVPLQDAIRIFRLAERCHARGEALPADLVRKMATSHRQVGSFSLDEIGADGTIRAGCHVIPYEESRRMAESLGLIEATIPEEADIA